jgi:hypothetical protein
VTQGIRDWQAHLRRDLSAAIEAAGIPCYALSDVLSQTLHLAVLVEPYLEWILHGRKTIESRFSMRRVAPYRVVSPGDLLVLKRSSGPIVGVCRVAHVDTFELDSSTQKQIRARYSVPLCAENAAFWDARSRFQYATLMHLCDVRRLPPFACGKQDRRGWVVLSRG